MKTRSFWAPESESASTSKCMTPTLGTRPVSSVRLATNWRLSTIDNQTHPDWSFDRQRFLYGPLSMCFSSCIFYSCIFHHCYLLLLLPLLHFPLPHFQRPRRYTCPETRSSAKGRENFAWISPDMWRKPGGLHGVGMWRRRVGRWQPVSRHSGRSIARCRRKSQVAEIGEACTDICSVSPFSKKAAPNRFRASSFVCCTARFRSSAVWA